MTDNCIHLERHARHALEDFMLLRKRWRDSYDWNWEDEKLWHSLSHHLRHATYRANKEIKDG